MFDLLFPQQQQPIQLLKDAAYGDSLVCGAGLSSSSRRSSSTSTASDASSESSKGGKREATNAMNEPQQALLHRACQEFPTNTVVVQTALMLDPEAARRPVILPAKKPQSSSLNSFIQAPTKPKHVFGSKKTSRRDYQYAINVALHCGASCEVVKLLTEAAPDAVLEKDGSQGMSSVSIALLRKHPHQIIKILLESHPFAATVRDRHQNTPLHVACQRPKCSLEVIQSLWQAHPQAMNMENFHGQTPLQIAQRNTSCPEDVVNFLRSKSPNHCV